LISIIIWTVVLFFTAPILIIAIVSVFIGTVLGFVLAGDIKGLIHFIKQLQPLFLPFVVSFVVGYGLVELLITGLEFSILKTYFICSIVCGLYFNVFSKKIL
jgi:hypothetical protein